MVADNLQELERSLSSLTRQIPRPRPSKHLQAASLLIEPSSQPISQRYAHSPIISTLVANLFLGKFRCRCLVVFESVRVRFGESMDWVSAEEVGSAYQKGLESFKLVYNVVFLLVKQWTRKGT